MDSEALTARRYRATGTPRILEAAIWTDAHAGSGCSCRSARLNPFDRARCRGFEWVRVRLLAAPHASSWNDGEPARSLLWCALGQTFADQVHDRRVGERGHVTEVPLLRHVAQQPAHDLARASLRQLGDDHDLARLGDRADLLGHVVAELADHAVTSVAGLGAQDDERDDSLPGGRVGRTDNRRLGYLRVRYERRLNLGGRNPVPGDVHDVVDPAEQPHVAVLVLLGTVPGEVVALVGKAGPVGVEVPLVIAPDGP